YDFFADKVDRPFLLIVELSLVAYFKTLVTGQVANYPSALSASECQFCVRACWNHYYVLVLFSKPVEVLSRSRQVHLVGHDQCRLRNVAQAPAKILALLRSKVVK